MVLFKKPGVAFNRWLFTAHYLKERPVVKPHKAAKGRCIFTAYNSPSRRNDNKWFHLGVSHGFANVSRSLLSFVRMVIGAKPPWACAAFSRAVPHIIKLRTEEKMVRPDTCRIVTMVTDIKRFIEGSISNFIRNPMCKQATSVPAFFRNNPIAILIFVTAPKPTLLGFFHLIPKALIKWSAFSHAKFYQCLIQISRNNRVIAW